ncbi:uncharacterized protein FA14DRAFT_183516 [Meira miltonrushii]|uniref:Uncharacterized protein n=1 Tax=Meira miltonrushii TaxID=1280837 RepID=A0A316VK17_9BASI|nr:uncharacterized protein FA14DRAFT_183516 [Meira miltonrushii]PWN37574.1 hypothetical protein FA14DRAFT_183516 [Meira miltonrushii]
MSLYSFNFDLLPPPPRSRLSWGSESSRAKLPDFKNVEELRQFMTNLFIFPFPIPHLMLQMKVGAGVLSLLLLVYLLIIARRMYERNFWILRIFKTPTGSVIAPNTILAFIVIEGAFVIVFIAMMLELRYYYIVGSDKPKNILLWILLPWSILIFGAFSAALGTHYATPRSPTISRKDGKHTFKTFLAKIGGHAITVNLLAIFIPAITCISVAIPSFIANARQVKGCDREKEWQLRYASEEHFDQQMVLEAQHIWYQQLKAIKIASATFCLWSFWGLFCFALYTALALRLIRAVKIELGKTELKQLKFIVTTICATSSHRDPIPAMRPEQPDPNFLHVVDARREHHISSEDAFVNRLPLWSETGSGASVSHEGQHSHSGLRDLGCTVIVEHIPQSLDQCIHELVVHQDTCDSIHSARSVHDEDKEHKDEDSSTFTQAIKSRLKLPNFIMTQKMIDKRRKESMQFSINEQKIELKKAMVNIVIQTLVISPGCACLSAIVLMFGLTFFGSLEQPTPNRIATYAQRFAGIALLAVLYTIILFGSICAVCVFFRVYEPIFVKNADNESRNRPTSTILSEGDQ